MRVVLYPYNIASESAIALQNILATEKGLRTIRVRQESSVFTPRPTDLIINWGNSHDPVWGREHIRLNSTTGVRVAANKLKFLETLNGVEMSSPNTRGVRTPDYTSRPLEALNWLREGSVVFARTILNGHSGEGIEILSPDEYASQIRVSPLYTKYKKKKNEYRVHVFNDVVIDLQEKKRASEVSAEERTTEQALIRSHGNGWNFCREDLDITPANRLRINEVARCTLQLIGLNFGAVDIIYNKKEETFYVLEVNTAPALTGQTLTNYANAIERLINP